MISKMLEMEGKEGKTKEKTNEEQAKLANGLHVESKNE